MNNFISKDLYISSMLYCQGKEFLGVNKSNGTYWFVFKNLNECNKLVSDYWLKKVKVDALSYVEAIRTLKNYIFTNQETEKMTN